MTILNEPDVKKITRENTHTVVHLYSGDNIGIYSDKYIKFTNCPKKRYNKITIIDYAKTYNDFNLTCH